MRFILGFAARNSLNHITFARRTLFALETFRFTLTSRAFPRRRSGSITCAPQQLQCRAHVTDRRNGIVVYFTQYVDKFVENQQIAIDIKGISRSREIPAQSSGT